MTLVEFLEANKDPSSSISLLSLAEFRNWMLLFGYWEGKQLRPIISQTRQQLEKLLLTTELVMPDSSDAAETASHVFKLTHRVTPLTAAPAVAEKMGHPASPLVSPHLAASDFVNEAMNKIRVAVLSHRPDAHQTAGLSPGSDYGRRLVESVIGPNAAPGAQPAPPAPPLPEPVGAEDREALAAITAEHDRLTAKAVQLYGLASPPVPLLNGLINELKRQIGNFEGQQQLVASRRDLAAFPAKLKFVPRSTACAKR